MNDKCAQAGERFLEMTAEKIWVLGRWALAEDLHLVNARYSAYARSLQSTDNKPSETDMSGRR